MFFRGKSSKLENQPGSARAQLFAKLMFSLPFLFPHMLNEKFESLDRYVLYNISHTCIIVGLIYAWQGALVIYLTTLVCRKVDGSPVYMAVPFIPVTFSAVYSLNLFSKLFIL